MKSDQKINKQDEGFAGTLKNIQLNDLIQMCCLSAVNLGIKVNKDEKEGTILIQDGEIVHAEVENIKGEEAFFKILGWESGGFETFDAGNVSEVTINQSYQFLLMEAAHQADEREAQRGNGEKRPESTTKKLKILVADDSHMMSKILSSMINADDRMEVVGTAENGERALEMLDELKPDLVILDVNMPVMGGSTAIKHIMIKSPCPVLIMSNLGDGSHKEIIEFLNLGAVDFMSKPVQNKHILLQQQKIVERILQAAGARTSCFKRIRVPKVVQEQKLFIDQDFTYDSMLIISAGAGGHSVMLELISRLPAKLSHCVLILQTIPPILTKAVASYLNERSQLEITPLKSGMIFRIGRCFFTGHGNKIAVHPKKNKNEVSVESSDTIQSVSDSFDELLSSMAGNFDDRIQIVLLSGSEIGTLNGLKEVRNKGGKIIIQKRSSCMVSTSLQKVVEEELVDMELDIDAIADEILKTTYSKITFRPT